METTTQQPSPIPQTDPKPKKPRRKTKIILITTGVIVLLALAALLYVNSYINRSLAQNEGTIDLPGLEEGVTVTTDDSGVPHINATNEHDLYMAQGYIQAQDRMFQMEMSRRQASGTLSEVVGEEAIDTDKHFRTLGLRRAAEDSYAEYSDHGKQVLEDFADGVNAYREDAIESGSLPAEFKLLGSEPAEWTPIDSLTIGKYMAFDLGGHWERQAFNYYALNTFDDDKAYELLPHYPEDKPTIIDEGEAEAAHDLDATKFPHGTDKGSLDIVGSVTNAANHRVADTANDPGSANDAANPDSKTRIADNKAESTGNHTGGGAAETGDDGGDNVGDAGSDVNSDTGIGSGGDAGSDADNAAENLLDSPAMDADPIDIENRFADAVIPNEFNGSNNWVVSGEKTESGKPLLANDPHLGLDTPSIWYQMHLEADDVNVEGVIFAGVPGIILGHNEDIAWGVTNTGPDVQQLYMEKRNPDAADEFLYEDEWEEADVIEEPIHVKDSETIDYEVT